MSNEVEAVRIALAELLSSIQNADLDRYKQLVSDTLTCYEPETLGNRLDGIGFHLFITARHSLPKKHHLELVDPVIRVYGDAAYAAYTLVVSRDEDDAFTVTAMNETRVFVKEDGLWKMVHFHRSCTGAETYRMD